MGRQMFGDRFESGTTGVCWDLAIHGMNHVAYEGRTKLREGCSKVG
jgi:hypothetical protein